MIDGLFPNDLVDKSWTIYSSVDEFVHQIVESDNPIFLLSKKLDTFSFVHNVKINALSIITLECVEDLVFVVHSNMRHLSRKTNAYKTGEKRVWDVRGDSFDSLGGIGILEVADLSLDARQSCKLYHLVWVMWRLNCGGERNN
jgi:hypothetical protein